MQATPDLTPTDLIGSSHYDSKTDSQRFTPAPVYQFLLLDELNPPAPHPGRAFEAMGKIPLRKNAKPALCPRLFGSLPQNPGTYLLAEAQLDRFLCAFGLPQPQ